ncbi:MAG TPA: hypothetical protein ENN18_07325 [Proteobacteria bacterium]|nr:hypothetical protein [Pseudomonadota bacterium]
MAVKLTKNGEVVFPVNNYLDGSNASSIGVYLGYAIDQGARKSLLDFSGVRNFEYFGMAILMDIIFQYRKSRGVKIDLQGLSEGCLAAARYLGFERVLET